ncbi:MAG: holo-ACP synthase [Thauera sp.]|nr:holo-ACP synthase [Thauera sp.]
MIVGIGTDIVRIDRFEAMLERHGPRVAERILGADELAEFAAAARPARFLAKRFAVKEAVAKAFGTGFRDGLSLRHIGVTHDALGRPSLAFLGRAEELRVRLGVADSHVSVADERDYAIAFVTLLRG